MGYMVEMVTNDEGEEVEINVPFEWEICNNCNGDGTHSKHLGSFTASEWDEQGFEFQEDYLAGHYDKVCEECGGSGKVRVPVYARMPKKERGWLREKHEAISELRSDEAFERRMLGGE